MATKLKNKYVRFLLWVLGMYVIVLAVCTIVDLAKHSEFLRKDAYLQSKAFNDELALHWNLIRYTIENKNYPGQAEDVQIGEKRRAEWNEEYKLMQQRGENRVNTHYEERINDAESRQKVDEVKQLKEERDKQLMEIKLEILKLMEIRKSEFLAYKDKEWSDVYASLAARGEAFHYSVRDRKSDLWFTNMPNEPSSTDMNQAIFSIKLPQKDVSSPLLMSINKYFQMNKLEGYFIIPRTTAGFSQIHADYAYINGIHERMIKEIGLLLVNLLILGLLTWYLRQGSEFQLLLEQSQLTWLHRIPVDVRLLLGLLLFTSLSRLINNNTLFQMPIRSHLFVEWTMLVVLASLFLQILTDLLLLYKRTELWREAWYRSLLKKAASVLSNQLMRKSILYKAWLVFGATVLLGACFVIAGIGMAEADSSPELLLIGFGYMILYSVTIVPFMYKRFILSQTISTGIQMMAAGHLHDIIPVRGRGSMADLAGHLNQMQIGFKTLLDKEMRSERLKTELITNVSHDLKTPLTSIINYVDLLKQKDLPPEKIESYVQVLDRKTQRLKVLIDDLFEASKMSSGAVELQVETVNVSSLLSQALAEFSNKIENSEVSFRVQIEHPQLIAVLDGRKTWRIFENLIANALKYAMPHTRVHLNLREDPKHVVFTIKNVSAYEIDFEAEELFERFKRGDQSRHTEGSGLGLSIAKSIAELQGGQLQIDLDGDLFKVTVMFIRKPQD